MSEVGHKALPELLAGIKGGTVCPVYLLHGDEFLYKSACRSLLDALVSPHHQGLNYEAIDGASENIYQIIERLNTFPLIPSAKVIAVHVQEYSIRLWLLMTSSIDQKRPLKDRTSKNRLAIS